MATHYPSWSLIPILCFLSALGIFSINFYLPSLPAIGKTLNIPEESVRLTLSMFFLGASIGHFFLGPVSDRMGRLIVAKAGILLFIFTSFICAHSQTLLALQIGLFFQGLASGAGSLIARSVGRDLYEGPYLTYFSATIMMIVSLSPGIAPTLGGVIEYYFGWQKKFYFLTLFGVAIALLVWLCLPETLETSKRKVQKFTFFKNYSSFLQNSYCRILCFIIAMQMSAVFCYVTLSPSFFISFFAWSPQEYGYVGISGALGNLVGFGFARHMSNRLHFHHGILIGTLSCFFLSCIYVYFCLAFQENPYLIILYIFLFYSSSALALANASAAALDAFPLMAGTSSAVIGMVQIGSGLLGSALASVLPTFPFILGIALGSLSLLSVLACILIGDHPKLGGIEENQGILDGSVF